MPPEKQVVAEKQTILVIDDEEVVRVLFSTLLEEEGYRAILAADGREGVELLDRYNPAVALVDKNLPDMSGLELIAEQKGRHPDTEFVMITGYASLDSAVKAMEIGAFSYLTKPFEDMDIVLDRIRAALEVANLRLETSVLKERLDNIDDQGNTARPADQPMGSLSHRLVDQVLYVISLLESFIDKREETPTPASWARTVDTFEQTARALKDAMQGKENS